MSKEDVFKQLNDNKKKLSELKARLSELEEKYELLDGFSSQCSTKINSFETNVENRKSRLSSFENVKGSVKSAAGYAQKMNDLLTGTEYNNAVTAISDLTISISNEKRNISIDIQDVEGQIEILEAKIETLRDEYNAYSEEVTTSGS